MASVRNPKQGTTPRWTAGTTAAAPPAPERLRDALEGVARFFQDRDTRPGVVVRRILGRPRKDDETLTEHLVQERRRRTRLDGSVDGSLVKTTWTAWEFLDLDCPADHSAVLRTVGYVLSCQDKPGHFGEGCDDERHARGLCRHAVSGFFAAGTADQLVAPLAFPTGAVVTDEQPARFAASCFALRTVLRAGEDQRATVIRHVDSLVTLMGAPAEWAGDAAPDLTFFALGALAFAPFTYRPKIQKIIDQVASGDAPWSGADLFHACDALLNLPFAATRESLKRAASELLQHQQASGAFDESGDEEKALVAARVLQLATEG